MFEGIILIVYEWIFVCFYVSAGLSVLKLCVCFYLSEYLPVCNK